MSRLAVRTLLSGDVQHIATNMREPDRQEVFAALGDPDMLRALSRAVIQSSHCWVSDVDGEPVAIFGCAPAGPQGSSGIPWALATNKVESHASSLVREGRRYVARMLEAYAHLINYVDARNTRSVRWLARIGFEIHPAVPFGALGLPFHRFELCLSSEPARSPNQGN